ncbi:hypothetical protein [Nonomuraea sp. JJY05]|uniref:hypothetical protein n=1 Tax=Nonomuraea sp. JJY05 TaxID=3350255 RepID=UPI00373F9E67
MTKLVALFLVFWGPLYHPTYLASMSGTYENGVVHGEIWAYAGQCARAFIETSYQPAGAGYYIKRWSYSEPACSPTALETTTPFQMYLDGPVEEIIHIGASVCRWTAWESMTCSPTQTIFAR